MPSNCYTSAIKLLSFKSYSTHQLQGKLEQKGFNLEEIRETLDELRLQGYVNDDLFKESRLKFLFRKGHTPEAAIRILKQEHLDCSLEEALNFFDSLALTEEIQIQDFLAKKLKYTDTTPLTPKIKQRLQRTLFQRGHDWQSIEKGLRFHDNAIKKEENDDESFGY